MKEAGKESLRRTSGLRCPALRPIHDGKEMSWQPDLKQKPPAQPDGQVEVCSRRACGEPRCSADGRLAALRAGEDRLPDAGKQTWPNQEGPHRAQQGEAQFTQ